MSTKGKTWEEIYGEGGAKKRRESLKNKPQTKSTKGKTWNEIYNPEEVQKRKQKMIEDNPIHKMSEETKKERSKKLSENAKKRTGEKNPFYNKHHTFKTKEKLRKINSSPETIAKYKEKSEKYFNLLKERVREVRKCEFCNKEFTCYKKSTQKFCCQQCSGHWNLHNNTFNVKINSWEERINKLTNNNVEYVGNHSFWITLKNKDNKTFYKNPDFIISPFSINKKVIEVWGNWWHRNDDIESLKNAYFKKGIKVLFLRDEDMKKTDNELEKIIGEFING